MNLKPQDRRNLAYIRMYMREGATEADALSFALTNTALMVRIEKGYKEARKDMRKLKKQELLFADLEATHNQEKKRAT